MILALEFPKNKVATTFMPLILLTDCFYDFIKSRITIPGIQFAPDLFLIALFLFSLKNGYSFRQQKRFTFLRRVNFALLLGCLIQIIILYIKGGFWQSLHPTTLLYPLWIVWVYLQIPIYGYISFRILEEGGYPRFLKAIIFVSVYLIFFLYYPHFLPRHNAFIGGLNIIVGLCILYNLIYHKYNAIKQLVLIACMLLAFFLPFYSFLRGAAITLVVVVPLFLISNRNRYKNITKTFLIIITIIGFVLVTIWKPITQRYSEHSRFGYESPFMLFQSISRNASNVEGRLGYWATTLTIFNSSPIVGTSFGFTFAFGYSRSVADSHMLHNYFVTAFADGGLIIAFPLIMLAIYAFIRGLYGAYKKLPYTTFHSCIALVIMSTYATNVFGHQPQSSRIGGIILMSSLVMLSSRKNRGENSGG